ncbi:MAG: acyl carrier protein [Oscillospiraceae bacterium]|nr:acyl carrier protein [Oscillospiraceae bacterium]
MNNDIITSIREYFFENFLFGYTEDEIKNDTSFSELGVLDSTGIMEIVSFIENKFNITINDSEITHENLDTINLMVDFINSKKSK